MQDIRMKAVLYTPDYVKLGVLPVLSGTVVLRRNEVSSFTLDVNGNHDGWKRFRKGQRVVIWEGDTQVLAGPVTGVSKSYSAGVREVTLSGSSDMLWLSQRITYPNPAAHPESQTTDAYYKRSGNAETLIRDMVRLNLGPDARTERRAPLVMAANGNRGGQVSLNSRFKNVLEEAHSLALVGNVTFQTRQDGESTRFEFRDQRDLTRHIRLSPMNGGVTDYDLEESAPTTTSVLSAGQGEGEARTIKLVTGNQDEWGVYAEEFRDRRDTDDLAELIQAGEERIEEGQATASVALTIGDTARWRFGDSFGLGDTITVNLGDDGTIQDLVQVAELEWSASGRTTKLTVGPTLEEEDAPRWVSAFDRLRREVSDIRDQ